MAAPFGSVTRNPKRRATRAGVANQVRIDEEVKTLVWPNGADFDPATLHDWPEHERAFRELAKGGSHLSRATKLMV